MSHWFYNILGFGGRALPAPVAELGRSALLRVPAENQITMSENHGPYNRRGAPGGEGCQVTALSITMRGADGAERPAHLLDAGTEATEIELLRTVAHGLGVKWGHDDFGWWAAVPSATPQ